MRIPLPTRRGLVRFTLAALPVLACVGVGVALGAGTVTLT